MEGFIIVTRYKDNAKVIININHICAIFPDFSNYSKTIITLSDGNYVETRESMDTIIINLKGRLE